MIETVEKYFPNLSEQQKEKFAAMADIYKQWNAKINVISRKDQDNFNQRHLLHSLAIAKFISFSNGTKVIDIGCGGGFPGIPLAVMFPNCSFTLVDSVGKKIKVAQAVAETLGLNNVRTVNARAEDINEKFHFVVSRAVTNMSNFVNFTKDKLISENISNIENGILYLKGGDLSEELKPFKGKYELVNLSNYFSEEFFETKKLLYLSSKLLTLQKLGG